MIQKDINEPVRITEERLIAAGFEEKKGIIDSYRLHVKFTYAKSEVIDLSRNSDRCGMWYIFLRQGNHVEPEMWHENDMVLLRNNVEYEHQLENLIYAITEKEFYINAKINESTVKTTQSN